MDYAIQNISSYENKNAPEGIFKNKDIHKSLLLRKWKYSSPIKETLNQYQTIPTNPATASLVVITCV